ncbi:hypothetical protein RO07_15555 [Pandoraea pulmonicola]|nr:hypothetical protein RO07_15555 [Pandoraea pulmonicola]
MVTNAMLQMWRVRGREGIEAAGGLDGVARQENIPAAALRHYLRADGHLTQRGEDRLNPSRTTSAMLRKW